MKYLTISKLSAWMLVVGMMGILFSCQHSKSQSEKAEALYEIEWEDKDNIPEAIIKEGKGHPQAFHPILGWRLKTYVYLDGTVRLLSGEYGPLFFNPAPFHSSAERAMLTIEDETIPLDYHKHSLHNAVKRTLRPGYFKAETKFKTGSLIQEVCINDLHTREVLIAYRWKSEGNNHPDLSIPVIVPNGNNVSSNKAVVNKFKNYGLLYYVPGGNIKAIQDNNIKAGLSKPLVIRAGYSPEQEVPDQVTYAHFEDARKNIQGYWSNLFQIVENQTSFAGLELTELKWSLKNLLGTANWDDTRGHLSLTNGTMYHFNHVTENLNQRQRGFYSFRDGNIVAYGLANIVPEVSKSQILRNIPAFKYHRGIPQITSALPGSEHHYKTPTVDVEAAGDEEKALKNASDQIYWFMLALTEYIRNTKNYEILNKVMENAHGDKKTIEAHIEDMYYFADSIVGYGPHHINRILTGDWNDYLGLIGDKGKGESFFNAGLSIVSKNRLAFIYEQCGRKEKAAKLRQQARNLKNHVGRFLGGDWFPRAVTDEGEIVGDDDGVLFLNTQTWLTFAQCGTGELRKKALFSAFDKCMTRIGPTLMNEPLPLSNEYAPFSYPPGRGENAGIWWLTGYWLTIALNQEGYTDKAREVYQSCSNMNHHKHFPGEWWSPFMAPDGIDGPVSDDFGKAQQKPFNRERDPNEVAKYAFKLWYATHTDSLKHMNW